LSTTSIFGFFADERTNVPSVQRHLIVVFASGLTRRLAIDHQVNASLITMSAAADQELDRVEVDHKRLGDQRPGQAIAERDITTVSNVVRVHKVLSDGVDLALIGADRFQCLRYIAKRITGDRPAVVGPRFKIGEDFFFERSSGTKDRFRGFWAYSLNARVVTASRLSISARPAIEPLNNHADGELSIFGRNKFQMQTMADIPL
jgi:hypothetical protein